MNVRNILVVRKGRLEEIFSKAMFADNSSLYTVSYRDFENTVEVSLPEFVKISENFELIPQSRILLVTKGNHVLYRKHGY